MIDYLLKPVSYERFAKTVDKIIDGNIFRISSDERRPLCREHIFIRSEGRFFRVSFSDILYVEGMKDYLKIHCPEHLIITHQTMGEMENILPSKGFIRIHKSYIISVSKIKAVFANSVDMGKILLPIGLFYKGKIMHFISGMTGSKHPGKPK